MVDGSNLSSIFGWISIACWIVVYSPQLYENYALQSAEGLSVSFVMTWLAGDVCNLFGAIIAGLLPTIIILGTYYTLCDSALLLQIYYYRWKKGQPVLRSEVAEQDERMPLMATSRTQQESKGLSPGKLVIRYTAALLFVAIVGTTAWWVAGKNEEPDVPQPDVPRRGWWISQVLGWTGAVLFIGARIPQIIKNFTTRCEGLSPALFFFSICGNTTYTLSIISKSMDKTYLLTSASWVAGSSVIVFLDVFVLCQFIYYRAQEGRLGE